MALPGAVTTCTVTYGSALTPLGAVSSISATLTMDRSVVWAATGQSINSGNDSVTATAGTALSFAVPHVNQSGFVYANGTPATNWFYTLTGVVTFTTGAKMTFRKNFQPLVGQTNLDLDGIEDDATVLPAVLVVAEAVTSVNGMTGAVTIDAGGVTVNEDGDLEYGGDVILALPVESAPADASTTVKGIVELATSAETTTGTDTTRAVTPAGLKAVTDALPSAPQGFPRPTAEGTYGQELWALANFRSGYNTTVLEPTLIANSTNQTLRTLVNLNNIVNQDRSFRLTMTVEDLPTDGWAEVIASVVNSAGTILAGSAAQTLITNSASTGGADINKPVAFDFTTADYGTGVAYLDVTVKVYNNATTGQLKIKDVSVKEVGAVEIPLLFGQDFSGNTPMMYTTLRDPVADTWRVFKTDFGADGALTAALGKIVAYNTDKPWRYDTPDPLMVAASVGLSYTGTTEELLGGGQSSLALRIANNDQIINVKKTNNTYELRGNVHGGETIRAGAANLKWQADILGNGTWTDWDGIGKYRRPARKFRFIFNTQLQRSDEASPFANVDHTCTFFPDGMMRMDRTTTFLTDQRINIHFEWMSSHDTSVVHVGRIGAGATVLDDVDTTALDAASSDKAQWAVWYDSTVGMCMGNIYDRDALASRTGVRSVTNRLMSGSGIKKNYTNAWFTGDGLDTANDYLNGEGRESRLFTAGTVWTATHWSFLYVPLVAAEYHREIAERADDLTRLKARYSVT